MPQNDGDESQIKNLIRKVDGWRHTNLERCLTDDYGMYCLEISTEQGLMFATTKKYKYKNLVSFPRRVVRRGADREIPVVVFFDPFNVGNGYVYDPELVLSDGTENRSDSDEYGKSVWFDISAADGVIYGDYITGRVELPTSQYEISGQKTITD